MTELNTGMPPENKIAAQKIEVKAHYNRDAFYIRQHVGELDIKLKDEDGNDKTMKGNFVLVNGHTPAVEFPETKEVVMFPINDLVEAAVYALNELGAEWEANNG